MTEFFLHVFGIVTRTWQSYTQTPHVLKSVNLIIFKILCVYLHAYKYRNELTENRDSSS